MPNTQYADYFLGANTPAGFRSMFEDSYSADDGWQVYIINRSAAPSSRNWAD